ncbi:MAG: hypothetical protein ACXWDO_11105 [Bacteroidia bacterium]
MSILNICFLIKNIKSNSNLALLACVLFFSASCRPERITYEEFTPVSHGTFRVESDYPYYYIVYRYGKMKAANTITIRHQELWEQNFTTAPGDTVLLEVHTITSNVQGTKIKADIIINNKTVQTQETLNECIDGDCFQAKPLDLSLYAVIK